MTAGRSGVSRAPTKHLENALITIIITTELQSQLTCPHAVPGTHRCRAALTALVKIHQDPPGRTLGQAPRAWQAKLGYYSHFRAEEAEALGGHPGRGCLWILTLDSFHITPPRPVCTPVHTYTHTGTHRHTAALLLCGSSLPKHSPVLCGREGVHSLF